MTTTSINPKIVDQLTRSRLVRNGHFVYESGLHSPVLFNRDRLLVDPDSASSMGYALAKAFFTAKVDTIATPSIWGAGLAQWVAWFLEPRAQVVVAYTGPTGDLEIATEVHDLITDKRVLLIDNLIFTGETMDRTGTLVSQLGGEVVGLGSLWSENERAAPYQVTTLLNDVFPVWEPEVCPLCREGTTEVETVAW